MTTPRAVAAGGGSPAGSSSSHAAYLARHGACGAGSTSMTVSPRSAHSAASARPAGPPPTTSTSVTLASMRPGTNHTPPRHRRFPGNAIMSGRRGGRDSLPGVDDEARAARRSWVAEFGVGLATSPFRVDRDRIAASPFFARLAGVTQVVSPAGVGLLVHNRLTHSLQVAQVARAIAERLACDPAVGEGGGCAPGVVGAAALPHAPAHPPFGHLGEQVLDRVARERLGLPDGFEGNAQSFRIVTTIDLHGPSGTGLDLTAAVRAAVLKYPWTRRDYPDPHPSAAVLPPRGGGPLPGAADAGSAKFSAYATELDDLVDCRSVFAVGLWQQTVEAAVMDTADDIAYAIHDLEDFHRVGVLQQSGVATELTGWAKHAGDDAPGSDLGRR